LAPEILSGRGYGKAVDMWGLGCLIYELLEGITPFVEIGLSKKEMFARIQLGAFTPPSSVSYECRDLLIVSLGFDN